MFTHRFKIPACLFILILATSLFGCNGEKNEAPRTIEAYIQALSNQDTNQVSVLSCKDWEQNALLEVDSLAGVGSKVEKLACNESGQEGTDKLISCSGFLALDYNGEAQQIDLSTRTYIARQEGGEWRMCGYK